jgi:hypothetical protein
MNNITALPNHKPTTVKAKLAFLKGHFRYHTCNSWNRGHSYAVNIKLRTLRLTSAELTACYDMLSSDEAMLRFSDMLSTLECETNWAFQIGTNGRSNGYAVLYTGGRKPTGYKSRCRSCRQKNYKTVAESGTRCGHCGKEDRVDFVGTHTKSYTDSRGLDEDADFDDKEAWDSEQIRARFDEVWAFDECVEFACRDFVKFAMSHKLVEETVMVPKKVMVAKEI